MLKKVLFYAILAMVVFELLPSLLGGGRSSSRLRPTATLSSSTSTSANSCPPTWVSFWSVLLFCGTQSVIATLWIFREGFMHLLATAVNNSAIDVDGFTREIATLKRQLAEAIKALADANKALADSVIDATSSATTIQKLELEVKAKQDLVWQKDYELELMRDDKDLARCRVERAQYAREIARAEKAIADKERERAKAEAWADHYRRIHRQISDERDQAQRKVIDLRKEIATSTEASVKLRQDTRFYFRRYQDAEQFDIVKRCLHECAETKGDSMAVAAYFAHLFQVRGGNLVSLGVDAARLRCLEAFVERGQDPSLPVQPTGFSIV